jgi:hypothetical protein
MKQILILILSIYSSISFSQTTKEIKRKLTDSDQIEYVNVLKSNRDIRHDEYKLTYNWKFYHAIRITGEYNMDKKVGKWIEYYSFNGNYGKDMRIRTITNYMDGKKNGEFIHLGYHKDTLQIGSYSSDEKVGIWQTYDNGVLIEIYDYTNGQSLLSPSKVSSEFKGVDVEPKFKDSNLKQFLTNQLNPINYKNLENIQGKIIITCIIDKEGKVKNIEVLDCCCAELDQDFINAIKKTSTHWEPAIVEGKNVNSQIKIPIDF